MNKKNGNLSLNKLAAWATIITIPISLLALLRDGFNFTFGSNPLQIPEHNSFYCELQPDLVRGGNIWTVIYRSKNGDKPWLRMVRSMGDEWDTKRRCEEISNRLDVYKKDGLQAFMYRLDPSTPNQYVVCAKTKKSGDNCPLVLTLLPKDDPYKELKEITDGLLLPDSLPSYQCDNPQNCPSPEPILIDLKERL